MKIFNWKLQKTNTAKPKEEEMAGKITKELIDSAFSRRAKEIESLRLYDRGEKTIIAPDLNSYSKFIQRTI